MKIPFLSELEDSQTVLIAGAGGGFDVFCGLPLFFMLKKAGKTVHLANSSFTQLGFCGGERPVPSLMRVHADTGGSRNYFPEFHLACWLVDRFGETPVYAIERGGVRPVLKAYQWLERELHPDTLTISGPGNSLGICSFWESFWLTVSDASSPEIPPNLEMSDTPNLSLGVAPESLPPSSMDLDPAQIK
jgi:hypothetical protein